MSTSMSSLRRFPSLGAALAGLLMAASISAMAEPVTLNVYGPGGPAPAMKEAAASFGKLHHVTVNVVAGPTPQWVERARDDADIVFSGAENMMGDFAKALPGAFDLHDVEPLYLRPVAILVRPGNPRHIQGFGDLLKPGVKVLTVAGAGQTGLWEDVAGRKGDIETVRQFRRNMVLPEAANSAVAKEMWSTHADIDAWLIWNIWQVANPALAQLVAVEEPYRIYRDTGVVLTTRGKSVAEAGEFVRYLASDEGRRIFARWGWVSSATQ